MALGVLHFVLVAAWAGVVGVELVLELAPLRRPELRPATVVFHYYTDLWLELPLLLGVLVTGLLLLGERPMDARLAVKLAGAALALGANLVCMALVVARHRGPPGRAAARSRWIYATGLLGIPGGLVALYLGLGYAGWLECGAWQ